MSNKANPTVRIAIIDEDLIEVAVPRRDQVVIEEIIDWAFEEHGAHPVDDELCEENPEYFTTLFIYENRPEFISTLVATLLEQVVGCAIEIR